MIRAGSGSGADAEQSDFLARLQVLRDDRVRTEGTVKACHFKIKYLLNCCLMASVLRSTAADLRRVMERAIDVLEPGEHQRAFLKEVLRCRRLPSRTTLYRHRLTLFATACLAEQELNRDVKLAPQALAPASPPSQTQPG